MTKTGDLARRITSLTITTISPPAFYFLLPTIDTNSSYILLCAILVALGIIFSQLQKGNSKKKDHNYMTFSIPIFTFILYIILNSSPTPLNNNLLTNTNNASSASPPTTLTCSSTSLPIPCLSLPLPPSLPPSSSCVWFSDSSSSALTLDSSSLHPPPHAIKNSTLRQSKCKPDFNEQDATLLDGAIENLATIALILNIEDSEWNEQACKSKLKKIMHRAMSPYCKSDCGILGVCDDDCRNLTDVCGRFTTYDILEKILPGGSEAHYVTIFVGSEIAPCLNDVFRYASGGGDEGKICDSRAFEFEYLSFGGEPGRDCLMLEEDPNEFLRGSDSDDDSPGQCSLSKFDDFSKASLNVSAYNDNLLLAANNASSSSAQTTEDPDTTLTHNSVLRDAYVFLVPLLMFAFLYAGDKRSSSTLSSSVSPSPSSELTTNLAMNLSFRGFFGYGGVFVAVSLLALGVLSLFLGYKAERNRTLETDEIRKVSHLQIMILYGIGELAFFYWFKFVMYWRSTVNALVDIHQGRTNPLQPLNRIPFVGSPLRQLMQFYYDNFAIHTSGRFSILLVISAEVFEFAIQSYNANKLASILPWPILSAYLHLIFINFLIFGTCMLSPERFVSSSTIITIDNIIDASYIIFNLSFVENAAASYWALTIPLWFSVDMVNDSFTRQAYEQTKILLRKIKQKQRFATSKANGTFIEDLCLDFVERLSVSEDKRTEIPPPPNFAELKPKLFIEDTGDHNIFQVIMEFTIPNTTVGQAFTFIQRYTVEEKGLGTEKFLKVFAKNWRCSHYKPPPSFTDAFVFPRDFTGEEVWKRVEQEDGKNPIFVTVARSCDIPEAPPVKGFIRGQSYAGHKFVATEDGGCHVTLLMFVDPGGLLPASLVNLLLGQQMTTRLEMYKAYFLEHKCPDGTVNGGVFPDDENIYNFVSESDAEAGGLESTNSRSRIRTLGSKAQLELKNAVRLQDLGASNNSNLNVKQSNNGKIFSGVNKAANKLKDAVGLQQLKRMKIVRGMGIVKLRRILGLVFFLGGVIMITTVNMQVANQQHLCNELFGECVWSKVDKLYFKDGLMEGAVCGMGVTGSRRTWELNVRGCRLKELGGLSEWREEYAYLEEINLSSNELTELPDWLEDATKLKRLYAKGNKIGEMGSISVSAELELLDLSENELVNLPGWEEATSLRELRLRGNKISGVQSIALMASKTLELADLGDNEITQLPYELMDTKSPQMKLLLDGNPCAEVVDWSGLGFAELPSRMVKEGYDNGGFEAGLRVLKLARNELDESVFEKLVEFNFTNLEELDVSRNRIGTLDGGWLEQLQSLQVLDLSWSEDIQVVDLVNAPSHLSMLNASFCGVDSITGADADKLQNYNLDLRGNNITKISWVGQGQLKKIPEWVRTLDSVTVADFTFCDVKEILKGSLPASLESLKVDSQNEDSGLRLHSDSFDGLSSLRTLKMANNQLTEDDMHFGLFGELISLQRLEMQRNYELGMFAASELFPNGSKVDFLSLEDVGFSDRSDFVGLENLEYLLISNAISLGSRLFSGLCRLKELKLGHDELSDAVGFRDDTFAGKTLCNKIKSCASGICHDTQPYIVGSADAAKAACLEQREAESEDKCECRKDTCSKCAGEDECIVGGGGGYCSWDSGGGVCAEG
ncbi:hypothetical protein TrLO_g9996 [Triparma laevis f. longispina]|uniref:START domain-containing protein n=1 Tax=Triparma laevis f. longispina TaxID=1714387 RepID=A0A9W7AUZ2_9STRA|nr:hypothetical protein TrLO_g9996 [Triparma laevis f. longispina]